MDFETFDDSEYKSCFLLVCGVLALITPSLLPCLRADTLKIGDVIHIKNLKIDCMLFAEGILLEDVAVNHALSSFEDALFCIHLQRQYSAALELDKCLQTHPNASSSEDVAILKYYHALQVFLNFNWFTLHIRLCYDYSLLFILLIASISHLYLARKEK